MQSILILVYILMPLTNGVRNYQNTMLGMYNGGVPKVPNSRNVYELYKNGEKKGRQYVFQKVNEDFQQSTPEASVENQDLENPQVLSAYFDLRRKNSASTEPPKLNLDFPIPGGQMGEYNPYPTLLRRLPNRGISVDIDSLASSEAFGQYFPVPPFPQGRVETDFIQGRGENDVPTVPAKIYSSPPIERAVPVDYNGGIGEAYLDKGYNGGNNGYNGGNNGYNGGSNGFNGGSNGFNGGSNGFNGGSNGFNGGSNGNNGENNDYDQDMNEVNKVIKALAPTEDSRTLASTGLDLGSKQNELLEQYKRISNTLNGKVIEKGPLGYIGGSNDVEQVVSVAYKGFHEVNNGFNTGLNGFEGSNRAKPDQQGYNIQYTGMKVRNNEYNGENVEDKNDLPAYIKRIKALPFLNKSWTTNSLNISPEPEEQEVMEKYKRILDMLNVQTL